MSDTAKAEGIERNLMFHFNGKKTSIQHGDLICFHFDDGCFTKIIRRIKPRVFCNLDVCIGQLHMNAERLTQIVNLQKQTITIDGLWFVVALIGGAAGLEFRHEPKLSHKKKGIHVFVFV